MRTSRLLHRAARALATDAPRVPLEQIMQLETKLGMGLEFYDSIAESSEQLMLETDPAARKPREYYLDRYRNLALGQVLMGLDYYDKLKSLHGPQTLALALKGSQARTLVAESLLARDKLQSQIRATQDRADIA